MNKKEELKITEGSKYRIYSIGGRDEPLETEGVCKGFISLGIDEGGVIIELGPVHKEKQGILRVIPIHTILAVEILDEQKHEVREDEKDSAHYYG
ncbi:MAG: hypothetical protein QXS02_05325 [Candidatus Thermoplasmatota archaeon]